MSFSEDAYLHIIDNWIRDEDKVITYRHLSLALGVSCNQAKSMLHTYVHKLRSVLSSHRVHLVYLVSGHLSEEEIVVKLVPEEELEMTKSQFSSLISVHAYSISKTDIRNPFRLQKASNLINENISELLKYSQITNPVVERRTLKYKSASHKNSADNKVDKFSTSSPKHPNESKNLLVGNVRPSEIKPLASNQSKSSVGNRAKNAQKKLRFSDSVKSKTNENVNRLDKGVKNIQLEKETGSESDEASSSSHSDLDAKPRRYFPQSLPQEVVESHAGKQKKGTGFLEDDSDEEMLPSDPNIFPIEATPQPSQITQELDVPEVAEKVPEKVQGKKRKRIQRPVSEHYVDTDGSLVTDTKLVMVSTTDDSESDKEEAKSAFKKVKPSNATKQSSLSSFFKK